MTAHCGSCGISHDPPLHHDGGPRPSHLTTAKWLAAKARSYHQDAQRLEHMGRDREEGETLACINCGMGGDGWAIVYRAVAKELSKCAKEVGG